jgi:hypothetical protein
MPYCAFEQAECTVMLAVLVAKKSDRDPSPSQYSEQSHLRMHGQSRAFLEARARRLTAAGHTAPARTCFPQGSLKRSSHRNCHQH